MTKVYGQWLVAAIVSSGAMSAFAQANAPLQDASVGQLIEQLSAEGGAVAKGFRPTRKPDASDRCSTAADSGNRATKILVVEYADDSAPQVSLAIRFNLNSDELNLGDKLLLDKLAQALLSPQLQNARFAVAGHTDTSGDERSADHNPRLSCARALSALRYLVGKGVKEDRLTAYGFGSKRLLSGLAGTAPDHRRVEIRRAPSS